MDQFLEVTRTPRSWLVERVDIRVRAVAPGTDPRALVALATVVGRCWCRRADAALLEDLRIGAPPTRPVTPRRSH